MKLRLSILYLLIPYCSYAQESAESLHQRLTEQLNAAQSIRVIASSPMMQNALLTISARRGDKFIIELGDRRVVCDGVTIWNYTPSRKSVVVSSYRGSNSTLSVEKILLDVISRYKPTGLRNENSSVTGSRYLLTLEPIGDALFGVRSITLGLSKKTMNIVHVSVLNDQGRQEWEIKSIHTNLVIRDSAFRFKPPKDAEVIDMRD